MSFRRVGVGIGVVTTALAGGIARPDGVAAWFPDDHAHPVLGVSPYSTNPFRDLANIASGNGAQVIADYTNWSTSEIYSGSWYTTPSPDVTTLISTASSGAGGWATCVAGTGNSCDRWEVTYRPAYWTSTQQASTNFWRALGCHEVTHTVGVAERSYADCLNANYFAANYNLTAARTPSYQANVDEINAVYKNVA